MSTEFLTNNFQLWVLRVISNDAISFYALSILISAFFSSIDLGFNWKIENIWLLHIQKNLKVSTKTLVVGPNTKLRLYYVVQK